MTTRNGFRSWCTAMTATEIGLVTLSNLRNDARGRIPAAELRAFIKEVEAQWVDSELGPEELMSRILESEPDTCFVAKAIPHPLPRVARVMPAEDLLDRFIKKHLVGLPTRPVVSDSTMKLIENANLGDIARREQIRGRRPFAWVTRTEDLEEVMPDPISDSPAGADEARRWLGLLHYGRGTRPVVLLYPPDLPTNLHPPTVFEGGVSPVYRSVTPGEEWGHAVDLLTQNDGLPEAVHPPVSFTGGFAVRDLGPVSAAVRVTTRDFLDRLPARWDAGSVEEVLQYA